ncbi:hypothetical protein [Pararobbsia silviterrae]|nr:hypothetical protein [Pararobbsia silviterrae]
MRIGFNGPPLNYAAGIEIDAGSIRAVVLGHGRSDDHASPWLRVVRASHVSIPDGAMSGTDILEPRAVARAIVDAFGGADQLTRWSNAHLTLGLPPCAVLIRSVALSDLTRHPWIDDVCGGRQVRCGRELGLDWFEERVLREAECVMSLDRDALCVDWFRCVATDGSEHATIIATTRQHVESRVEAAALSGLRVAIVDGNAEAALRACRFWVQRRSAAETTYAVIWGGAAHVRIWCVHDQAVEMALDGETDAHLQRLACWARERKPGVIVVALDDAACARSRFATSGVASEIGCETDRFSLGQCCAGLEPQTPALRANGYAVAFGLALRGIQ